MSGEQLLYNRPTFPAQLDMSHPLTKGLVGCWVLNEEGGMRAFDSSPYKNHGLVKEAKGNYRGRTFDGLDDKITIPSLSLGTTYTISAWFNLAEIKNQVLVGKSSESDTYLNLFDATTVRFGVHGELNAIFTIPSTALNTWYFITWARDNGTSHCYINSIESTTGGQVQGPTLTVDQLGYYATGGAELHGLLGEVLIYNCVLTAAEIQQHYLSPYDMFLK